MSDASETQLFVQKLNALFDRVEDDSRERHLEGGAKYGPLKFLGADTLQELYEEVLDLINYGRYTAVKVLLLQEVLAQRAAPAEEGTTGGFVPTSELLGLKEDEK